MNVHPLLLMTDLTQSTLKYELMMLATLQDWKDTSLLISYLSQHFVISILYVFCGINKDAYIGNAW